ncbi:hypothetical protein [Spirillospora sp. NPDC047279]|uniref:hypothetical protein n=1 Tax=Spirillospora sp. NPDC047279 TaxID=3155478 RepID=UPI0033CE1E84
MASARYKVSDVGAWLTATGKGMIVHANGLLGKVDGKAQLPARIRNSNIKIIQDGNTVLLVDEATGVVSRIDPSQLKVTQSRAFGPGVQIAAADGVAYTVDLAKGAVQQIDPVSLAAVNQPVALPPPLDMAGLDARGTLWVPLPQSGTLQPILNGVKGAPAEVARPGAELQLSMVAGVPTVLDTTTGTAAIVGSGGVRKVALLSSVRGAPKVPARVEGQTLPILGAAGSLVLLDTGTGRLTSAGLRLPQRHAFGAPQVLGSRVYIPDETAGELIVYNSATGRIERPVRVSGRPGAIDVFVKDGMLWANDPDGDKAVAIGPDGVAKPIQKYTDKVPGGQRRPIPSQGDGGDRGGRDGGNGNQGGDRPGNQGPRKPGPDQPPTAPSGVRATGENGTIKVDFVPSGYNRILPAEYVLTDAQNRAVPGAQPASVPASGQPYQFTVGNLPCEQTFQFRVHVRYQDPRSKAVRNGSHGLSNRTAACVNPKAPESVQAQANPASGDITVNFVPGADSGAVTGYVVTNDQGTPYPGTATAGPGGPYQFVVEGLACQAGDYTFKVAARYTEQGQEKEALSQSFANARPCNEPGAVTGLSADPVNHGATVRWGGGTGRGVTFEVTSPGGTQNAGTATSANVTGLANNTTHQITVRARNGAGETTATTSVNLAYQTSVHRNKANNQTNTIIRPQPRKTGEAGRINQGQYIDITVICQIRGESVTESETGETSVWWNRINWNGGTAYLSVTLMEGPRQPGGTMFECA